MKKILFLSFLAMIAIAKTTAQEIKWMDITEAEKRCKENPKQIFIDVYTDWCGWCKRMDSQTFAKPEVAKYMNETFYCVKLDAESTKTIRFNGTDFTPSEQKTNSKRKPVHMLAATLLQGNMSYPSYVFLTPNNEVITVVKGFREAPEMLNILKYIGTDAYKTQTPEEFIEKNK